MKLSKSSILLFLALGALALQGCRVSALERGEPVSQNPAQEQKAELTLKQAVKLEAKADIELEPKQIAQSDQIQDKLQSKSVTLPVKAEAKPSPAKLPTLPKNAVPLIEPLRTTIDLIWPNILARSYMASKIEQESCVSLKHSRCWSPRAELKTDREYGFGLGQITVAFHKDGTERFNVWKELTRIDPVLKEKWTWDNRFDATLQLRATIIKSKASFDAVRFKTASPEEHMAFGLVTYNAGSVLVDRRICVATKGCDPSRWYGNVELYSKKSKVAQKGYGKSFYAISREYPRNIMYVRRDKYIPYMDN